MEFTLNRNKVVTSTKGHTIEFIKDVPVRVPPEMHSEVMAIGAIPCDELPVEDEVKTAEPNDPTERKNLIKRTMEQLVIRDKREDFTASGLPDVRALKELMGFGINHKERDALWAELQAEKRGEDA